MDGRGAAGRRPRRRRLQTAQAAAQRAGGAAAKGPAAALVRDGLSGYGRSLGRRTIFFPKRKIVRP